MTDAHVSDRARILSSIRIALGPPAAPESIAAEYGSIARTYTQSGASSRAVMLEVLAERLLEYDAGVYHASSSAISARIAEILTTRGKTGLVIPRGVPSAWLPQEFHFEVSDGHDAYQLDKTEGVLTGCTVAVAETGSIVLQNAPTQGPRILSLVPDYHLCVVFANQVVATVPESFARLSATASLPTTFISGPSATADIEMTRIKGVHGPRFLDVVIVDG
jgi:L-lactate dehydrogenase complex protein LldG